MSNSSTITALDVGTGSVKAIIVEKRPEESGFKVLGRSESISSGVRKGVVSDPEKVSKIISATLNEVRRESGREVREVYVNINGNHISSISSKGLVSVSRADQKISQEDIDRVIEAAKAFSLPSNKEIIEVIPREFTVDKEGGIKDPLGLQGVRLETEILAVSGFSRYSKDLADSVLGADLQVSDLILGPLASAKAVLTQEERELGVAVVDIGAGTTSIAVFEEGNLIHIAVLPVGTNNIRNDIAIGLRINIETAEFIKNKFGASMFGDKKAKKEKIKIPGGEDIVFQRGELKKITEARILEMFEEIGKELKKVSRFGLLPAGVVLTGGGSKAPGLVEFTRKKMGLPCRIGFPRRFFPLDDDPAMSVLCGLALCGFEMEEGEGGRFANFDIFRKAGDKIKKVFRVFIP